MASSTVTAIYDDNSTSSITYFAAHEPNTAIDLLIRPTSNIMTSASLSNIDQYAHEGEQPDCSKRTRSKGHTREEWEDIRHIFTNIYGEPDMTLETAMQIMAKQYGFHATKPMYKKRITEWNIKKNLTFKQKEFLALKAESLLADRQDLPIQDSNGHVIHWNRVRRQDREQKRRSGVWKNAYTRQKGVMMENRRQKQSKDDSTFVQSIQPPADVYHIESTLFELQQMLDWLPSSHSCLDIAGPYIILEGFYKGSTLLTMGLKTHATQLLHKAAVDFVKTLGCFNPLEVVAELIVWRIVDPLRYHPQYHQVTSSFILKSVSKTFDTSSPAQRLYTLILSLELESVTHWGCIVLSKLVDSLPEGLSYEIIFQLRLHFAETAIRQGLVSTAHITCTDIIASGPLTSATDHVIRSEARLLMGITFYLQGHATEAEMIWTEIAQPVLDGTFEGILTYQEFEAILLLALQHEELGNIQTAKHYFEFVIARFGAEWGHENADIVHICDNLVNLLVKNELAQELEALRIRSSIVRDFMKHRRYPYNSSVKGRLSWTAIQV